MDQHLQALKSTTFGGRRFTRKQLLHIQTTTRTFSNLSRRELSKTLCEHLGWVTPAGKNCEQACLSALEEMAAVNLIQLPAKITTNARGKKKPLSWSEQTDSQSIISASLASISPLRLAIVSTEKDRRLWNEYVDRHHYLGYKHPIGSHLRYFIVDANNRKLGCLSFSFASRILPDRDQWIGWDVKARKKRLNLVLNNNRYLIFPWVNVKNLASKALAMACQQLAGDWQAAHGYQPVLLETFVDTSQFKGTCYRAANWIKVGETKGSNVDQHGNKKTIKEIYLFPLSGQCQQVLTHGDSPPKRPHQVAPKETRYEANDPFVRVWQKVLTTLVETCNDFDAAWRKRKRLIDTQLLVLFIFRLVFSKNKQSYGATITELWDQCRTIGIELPQSKPAVASAFSNARAKLDEDIFKLLNAKIISHYTTPKNDSMWLGHRLFAVDGTKVNLPRQLLQIGYKLPHRNAHYPFGLVSCLYELRSKIPIDFDLKVATGERTQALSHLTKLTKGDIVVYDRGYFSYVMLYWHIKKEIHPIFRMPIQTYTVISDFMRSDKTDEIVELALTRERYAKIRAKDRGVDTQKLTLRLVKYQIGDKAYTLGTTLLDRDIYPVSELSKRYHERWGIEELYKVSKALIEVQDFHGKSERGVKQELYAHFVIITLSRIFANHIEHDINDGKLDTANQETRLNMKNCLLTMSRHLESLLMQHNRMLRKTLSVIVNAMVTCRQKVRPGRSYKRRSKKPFSKWQPNIKKKDPVITPTLQGA